MAWQAVALASEFLPCQATVLNRQAVSGVLPVCQAVLLAALSISLVLSSVWQAVPLNCPATLSVCRAAPKAALSACQAVSLAWRAGPSDCPGT